MLQLTERQKGILLRIIRSDVPISIVELAKNFGISPRTIRYDLEDIKYWLKQKDVELKQKSKVGIWLELDCNVKVEINKYLRGSNTYNVLLSKDKRINYILIEFIKAKQYITTQYLADFLKVSQSTIVKDLKLIRNCLKEYNIDLVSKPRVGQKICGNERDIRKLLSEILIKETNGCDIIDLISTKYSGEAIVDALNDLSVEISLNGIKKAIKNSKKKYDFWMPDSSYASLVVHLAIAMDRLLKGQEIALSKNREEVVKKNKEFLIAKEIAKELSRIYRIEIPEAEVVNITIHLISANMRLNFFEDDSIYNTDKKLLATIKKMIIHAKNKVNLDEKLLPKLEKDLYSHIQLTLKKATLDIAVENPLLSQIKSKYSKYFAVAKEMVKIFEENENVILGENEAGYIALHLGACFETAKTNDKKNVLIVCSTGKGSAKILSIRIKKAIPDINVKGLVSVFDIEEDESILDDIDFVISTVNLRSTKKAVIKVSPLITNSELAKIKNHVVQSNGDSYENSQRQENNEYYMVSTMMDMLNKYVDKEKQKSLRMDLNNYFDFFMGMYNRNVVNSEVLEQHSQKTAMIVADLGVMIQGLIGEDGKNKFPNILGVIIHLIMAVPRWERKVFYDDIQINESNCSDMKVFKIVKEHLNIIENKYNLQIPDNEILSIVRYLE